MQQRVYVGLTHEEVHVVYTGYRYFLLFLLLLFLLTAQHRQLVEFQGNYIVVIYEWIIQK